MMAPKSPASYTAEPASVKVAQKKSSKAPSTGTPSKRNGKKSPARQGGNMPPSQQHSGNAPNKNTGKPAKQKAVKAPQLTGPPLKTLTWPWIREQAKPGNWRRGLEMHLANNNAVQHMDLENQGISARVKGNYKSHYSTNLIFKPNGILPQCNCAIEEPWCKHAIAVALSVSEQQLWEAYWDFPEDDLALQPIKNAKGILKVQLHLGYNKAKGIGLRLIERERDTWCAQPDKLLRRATTAEFPDGTPWSKVPEARQDIGVLQLIERLNIRQVSNNGWMLIPFESLSETLHILAGVEELLDEKGNRLLIEDEPLYPVLELHQNNITGQMSLALQWQHFEAGYVPENGKTPDASKLQAIFPLETLELLDANAGWGKHYQRIYALYPALKRLPKVLKKGTFTDIPMQDGGRFLFEVLPNLRELLPIDDSAMKETLNRITQPPVPSLNVEMLDPVAMRLRLVMHFNYDKARVAYSRSGKQEAYVVSTNKKKNRTAWHKRDIEFEDKCWDRLNQACSQLLQNNALMAESDEAVDLFNFYLPRWEKEGWIVNRINPQHMGMLQASHQPLVVEARLEFDESVTFFTLKLEAKLANKRIPLSSVQEQMVAGKKYFFVAETGFVEVPLHTLLAVSRTLQAFEPEEIDSDFYRIPTFKAGLIAEMVDSGIKLNMSKKFQRFWDVMTKGKPMEELEVPDNIKATLRPYQERGFQWLWFLYSYGLNGILADDMGLGKTLQAIVALQQAKNKHGQFPSLIVCPTTLVTNWQNELNRFAPELDVLQLTGSERYDAYQEIRKADVVVTSYAILRRDINALKGYPFRFAILDESQQIKNKDSQTALAAKELQSQHRIALSGTPIENRLSELWSVFDFLMPDFLERFEDFRRRFIQPIEERANQDAARRLNKQVSPFILRRLKRDVLKDLPPKMEQVLYCDLTDNQRQLYLDVLEKAREELMNEAIERGGKISHQHVFSALTRLRQVCNHPALLGPDLSGGLMESGKFEALQDLLQNAIENGHRVLLFSQFVQMLKLVERWLKTQGIEYEMLTGATKSEERQGKVDRFNKDERLKVFLVSLKAGGTGINLTGADTVIHYDPWWNPAAEDQATDRVHRIGQTKKVFVYRLIARGTLEERIMQLKAQKKDLVDGVISADRNITKKISLDDLKDILSLD
jgi:SNF2 family DNA or RNA helicase